MFIKILSSEASKENEKNIQQTFIGYYAKTEILPLITQIFPSIYYTPRLLERRNTSFNYQSPHILLLFIILCLIIPFI